MPGDRFRIPIYPRVGNGAHQAISITVTAIDGIAQVIHRARQANASGFRFTHASGTERARRMLPDSLECANEQRHFQRVVTSRTEHVVVNLECKAVRIQAW